MIRTSWPTEAALIPAQAAFSDSQALSRKQKGEGREKKKERKSEKKEERKGNLEVSSRLQKTFLLIKASVRQPETTSPATFGQESCPWGEGPASKT